MPFDRFLTVDPPFFHIAQSGFNGFPHINAILDLLISRIVREAGNEVKNCLLGTR